MDLYSIIITSIINLAITGVVSGIVVYSIQKKIDAAFEKSLYVYQTKFSKNYHKTLEVLEILHEKFSLYIRSCNLMIVRNDENQKDDVLRNLTDFHAYFSDNRMYIPGNLENQIQDIFTASIETIGNAKKTLNNPESQASLVEHINELQKLTREIEKIYKLEAGIK